MAENLVEQVRRDMGYSPLQKVDPNIQEVKNSSGQAGHEKLAQAAIPAVLAGFFKFTRTDKGCNYILAGGGRQNWLDTIFEDKKDIAVARIAQYAGVPVDDVSVNMEGIARQAVITIHEGPGKKLTAENLRAFMSNERHHILVHLPAALQLGDLLNDNAMDDRTNKMEGPVSNFMHKIENKLSGGSS